MKFLKFTFFYIILLHSLSFSAQTSEIYTWFDQEIGLENSGLFNGIEFINLYNPINEKHRFFESSKFKKGDVVYNDQTYYNIDLKHDIFEDQLIVKIETKKGTNQILLLKKNIESFRIGDAHFKKIDEDEATNIFNAGFYQVLVDKNQVKLYKRNHKKISKGIKNNAVYYEFKEIKPIYIANIDGNYFEIKRKRDLTKRYPNYKKELSKFRWTSRNYQKNDSQLILAINKLNQILEK